MNANELVLPLVIIVDRDYVNNEDFTSNVDLFMEMLITYYNSPRKDGDTKILYTRISIEKLSKLFFKDKIFLNKLILSDKNEKQISYISFSDEDFVLGLIKKRGLFNRKSTEEISLQSLSYFHL